MNNKEIMKSTNTPGSLLFLVSKAQFHLASHIFEQMGLFRGQPPVLFQLGLHEGITQVELAEILEVTPATMTNILRRMQTSGLITRVRDTADARISHVFLTAEGRLALDRAHQMTQQMDGIAFNGLSPDELVALTDLLGRVHSNLRSASGVRCRVSVS